jgi:hypothetical protein
LAEAQQRTEANLETLAEAQRQMAEAQRRMQDDLGQLKQSDLERRYRERAHAYLGRLIRRAHALSYDELYALTDRAIAEGQLTQQEADDLELADMIVRGRRKTDGAEVFLVVEVSWGVGVDDNERAIRRARLLARTGVEAVPVVAGVWITPDAETMAKAWQLDYVVQRRAGEPEAA